MSDTLAARVNSALSRRVDAALADIAKRLGEETGARAVLFYGSNLRTGSLDGVLDFYVLLSGSAERGLWPRVSYREWAHDGQVLRAKIATMSLARFREAARGETIDTTIWARFVQPSALVWAADEVAHEKVAEALAHAAMTAVRLAVAIGPPSGSETDYWRALFRATYRAELRVEKPGREDSIIGANAAHFDGLLPAALAAQGIPFGFTDGKLIPRLPRGEGRAIRRWWRLRRRLGKPLNIARLARARGTFEGAARYAAWKIHRHTGVEVEITPWRERHPALAAPGVLWRVWRARRRS